MKKIFLMTGCVVIAGLNPAFAAEPKPINPFPLAPKETVAEPPPAQVLQAPQETLQEVPRVMVMPKEQPLVVVMDPPPEPEYQQEAQPEPPMTEPMMDDAPLDMPMDITESVPASAKVSEARHETWLAYAGADLREVLMHWAQRENVELLWATPDDFPVLMTLEMDGSFEEAVAALLEQYSEQYLRPVGSLHKLPGGHEALVIAIWQDQ